MSVTAFNTPSYPQVWPFEGFTLDWFSKLAADRNLMEGLVNSFVIGAFVWLAVRLLREATPRRAALLFHYLLLYLALLFVAMALDPVLG